jgi:hypothetical protein
VHSTVPLTDERLADAAIASALQWYMLPQRLAGGSSADEDVHLIQRGAAIMVQMRS